MCEQSQVIYNDGDIVWVKLGAMFWPGKVKDVDKLPEEILSGLRKKPIAAVQFFDEEKYEYVKNLDQIFIYNCRRKNEFIKKGLDKYTNVKKDSDFMDKFPSDVIMAEKLTGGDINILSNPIFAPTEKPNYKNIFGNDKSLNSKKPVRKRGRKPNNERSTDIWDDKRERKSTFTSPSSTSNSPNTRLITHPRFTYSTPENQHEVRIRQQPSSNSPNDNKTKFNYNCEKCNFNTNRLNVFILHNKFHQQVDPKSPNVKTPKSGKGRPKGSTSSAIRKNVTLKSPIPSTSQSTKSSTPRVSSTGENSKKKLKMSHSEKIQTPTKRKSSKVQEETKKMKINEEITKKLLEDWDEIEEDEEETSIISKSIETNDSTQIQEKEPIIETEISKEKVQEEKDCFDFDEKIDSVLNTDLEERAKKFAENRKIPKVSDTPSSDENKQIKKVSDEETAIKKVSDEETTKSKENKNIKNPDVMSSINMVDNQESESKNNSDKNELLKLDEAFKHLMEETSVPLVPSIDISKKIINNDNSENEIDLKENNHITNENKNRINLNTDLKNITEKNKKELKSNEKSTNIEDQDLDINALPFLMVEESNIDLPPSTSGETHTLIINKGTPLVVKNDDKTPDDTNLIPSPPASPISNKKTSGRKISSDIISNQASPPPSPSLSRPTISRKSPDDTLLNSTSPPSPILNKKTIRRIVTNLKNQSLTSEPTKPSTSNQFSLISKRSQMENQIDDSKNNTNTIVKTKNIILGSPQKNERNIEPSLLDNKKVDSNITKSQVLLSPKSATSELKATTDYSKNQTHQAKQIIRLQKDSPNKKQIPGQNANTLNKIVSKQTNPICVIKYNAQQESSTPQLQRPRILGSKSRILPSKSKTSLSKQSNTESISPDKKKSEGTSSSVKEPITLNTSQNSNQTTKITSNIEPVVPSPLPQVIAQTQDQAVDGTTTYVLLTIDGSLSDYDGSSLVINNSQPHSNIDTSTSNDNPSPQTLFLDTSSADIENLFLINNDTNPNEELTDTNPNIPTTKGSQDILAAALANTDVFQTDTLNSDIKTQVILNDPILNSNSTIVTPSSQQSTMLPLPPTNPAGVSETSLTLNQPIMSPLEVRASMSNLQVPPPAPTALDLPITITEPAFASLPSSTISTDYQTTLPIITDTESNQPTTELETIETEVIEQFSQEGTFNYSDLSDPNTQDEIKR